MKLILSRKGFDSSSGGCPSPIFPDGTLYSLPIPDCYSKIKYSDIRYGDTNIGEVVENLTNNNIRANCSAHLDPDINAKAYPRQKGWHPLLGQSGAAQGHLRNQGVQIGDLFLFFGLYSKVEKTSDRWWFVKDAPEQHILWGWLQIGEIRKVDELAEDELPWARYHPHLYPSRGQDSTNTLYIASEVLDLGDGPIAPGAGRFPKFHRSLVLTEPGKSVTYWRLPRCFFPDADKTPLTYHVNLNWKQDDEYAYVQRNGPGQEFVLNLEQYPGVTDWFKELVCALGQPQ